MKDSTKWPVSIILSIMSIIIPIFIYYLSQSEKSISYEYVNKTEIIGNESALSDLEIIIQGKSLNQAILLLLKVKNSGSLPIISEDFEKPIYIEFNNNSEILNAVITSKTPKNLSATCDIKGTKIAIEPFLFNPGDEFNMEILSTSNEYPSIDSRIAGVTEIWGDPPERIEAKKSIFLFILFLFLVHFYSNSSYALISAIKAFSFRDKNYYPSKKIACNSILQFIISLIASVVILHQSMDVPKHLFLIFSTLWIPCVSGTMMAMHQTNYYYRRINSPN